MFGVLVFDYEIKMTSSGETNPGNRLPAHKARKGLASSIRDRSCVDE
jgi:hypothetical protein